jgi:hypothetical protein
MRQPVSSIVVGVSLLAPLVVSVAQSSPTAAELSELRQQAQLVPLLEGAVAVLAVGVAVLAWRLRRRTQQPQATQESSPVGAPVAAPASQAVKREEPGPAIAPPPQAAAQEPMSVTLSLPASAVSIPHGQSIEEHIDVDQQAQFLCVLGQDEAAIDLLLDHLRGTGGTSPLPYLRLMEIYRKRGDEAAYDRTRERFNLRFNATAPQWQADVQMQQALEAYPEVLAEVQRAWSSPLDAMAVIESLLFRRGSEDERFDLPAYEELLFLYWLTRELQQLADSPPSQVDVLLPLDDQVAEVSVIERPAAAMAFDRDGVDLDLSTVPGPSDDEVGR